MPRTIHISAVIPTYNREKTIARAIDSALAQEYFPSEIIVIDDGSTDNTRKVVDSYGNRIRYIYQDNRGVSGARNRGVYEAQYEWIAFLDSDDYWLPDHLSRIVIAVNATGGQAGLYFCDVKCPSNEGGGRYWDLCGFKITGSFEFKLDAGEWALMRIQPMMLQASVIRRTLFLEVGGLPEQLRTREDTLLFLRLGLRYPICAVADCGTVMTSDSDTRLTREFPSDSLTYWHATIFLYHEVLRKETRISRGQRMSLIRGLSKSYYSFGRIYYRRKKYSSSVGCLLRSGILSPSMFWECTLESLEKRVFKRMP